MEKANYPLIVTDDITIDLFEHPTVGLDGNDLKAFIPLLVKNNKEYSPIVLDKGFGLDNIEGAEYVTGERKTLQRLKELAVDEVDRRMEKLFYRGSKNFYEYNIANNGEDKISPRIIIFAGAKMTRRSEELIKRLSCAYGKMTGLFPIYCYPPCGDISNTILSYASLFIYANKDDVYIKDYEKILSEEQ